MGLSSLKMRRPLQSNERAYGRGGGGDGGKSGGSGGGGGSDEVVKEASVVEEVTVLANKWEWGARVQEVADMVGVAGVEHTETVVEGEMVQATKREEGARVQGGWCWRWWGRKWRRWRER